MGLCPGWRVLLRVTSLWVCRGVVPPLGTASEPQSHYLRTCSFPSSTYFKKPFKPTQVLLVIQSPIPLTQARLRQILGLLEDLIQYFRVNFPLSLSLLFNCMCVGNSGPFPTHWLLVVGNHQVLPSPQVIQVLHLHKRGSLCFRLPQPHMAFCNFPL
jgi:hypothetical protein